MIIICDKYGQLGNRMILYAHFIANATEYDYKVFNPCFDDYARYFKSISNNIFITYPNFYANTILPGFIKRMLRRSSYKICNKIISFLIKINFKSSLIHEFIILDDPFQILDLNDPKFLNLIQSKKIIFIKGWPFRDIKNFSKHMDIIKKYFIPEKIYENNVNKLIYNIRNNCDILIGIHIRHGDYKSFQGGKYYYDYTKYAEVMDKVKSLFPNKTVHFLICSNEKISDKIFNKFKITMGTNHIIEDMYALSKCDFIAGPPSTYTMWASFYGSVPLYIIEDDNNMEFNIVECPGKIIY